jgi:hypothetical protein
LYFYVVYGCDRKNDVKKKGIKIANGQNYRYVF